MRRSKKLLDIIREFPDRGDQWLLETPENVRGLLLSFGVELAERLDFTRVQRMPTRFISGNLHKHEADLLYRIPYRSEEGQGRGRSLSMS
ncbi:MAG TPA: hypothetical protein VFJ58_07120 [Armatimonadota bacterium]|nr:hypothetical protein [Armatimonadota bacterium]